MSKDLYRHFLDSFEQSLANRVTDGRRIGAELKFPLVKRSGEAADYATIHALWRYLISRGWRAVEDSLSGKIVGASKPGEQNETVASCETGYCKTEFSLAHVGNLFELERAISELREELKPFADRNDVRFLAYGIQPVTPPSKRLLMKKSRTSVWDKVFASNRHIPPEDGDDMHLFTINAASHVHVSVSPEEAVPAVNVLNGFTGAQIALTAHSNVWRGRLDPQFKCVAEKFWDWWMPQSERVGVPARPFKDLEDYVRAVSDFSPVYVKREGVPIVPKGYDSFSEYCVCERARGEDPNGREVFFEPEHEDFDLHCTCYWFNARLSRYYTVENRVNDEQPPHALPCIAALTLGLMEALPEAQEALSAHDWNHLRQSREAACRDALLGKVNGRTLADLARELLDLAELGLRRRGKGEEKFLDRLEARLREKRSPADETEAMFRDGGVAALVEARAL